jgi:4-carboxymuconolactone decarboxylase
LPRIPPISEESLTDAQRRVYDKVVAGPRGTVIGPLRAVLHSPELADRWQSLGEYLRFDSCLPLALRELAIITVGRYWNSELEWLVHSRLALDAGISDDVIESIRTASSPTFADSDQAYVYNFARELLQYGNATDDTYGAVRDRLGTVGIVELTAIIGYYTMVAMTLNAHDVPLPQLATPIPPLQDLSGQRLKEPTALPPAQLAAPKQAERA